MMFRAVREGCDEAIARESAEGVDLVSRSNKHKPSGEFPDKGVTMGKTLEIRGLGDLPKDKRQKAERLLGLVRSRLRSYENAFAHCNDWGTAVCWTALLEGVEELKGVGVDVRLV